MLFNISNEIFHWAKRFVKGYRFLSFAENTGKNVSKNEIGNYNKKCPDHVKQSAIEALETTLKNK